MFWKLAVCVPKQPYVSPSLNALVVQSVPWGPQPYVWVAFLRVQQRVVTTWHISCRAWPWSHLLENQGWWHVCWCHQGHQGGIWHPGPVPAIQLIALGGRERDLRVCHPEPLRQGRTYQPPAVVGRPAAPGIMYSYEPPWWLTHLFYYLDFIGPQWWPSNFKCWRLNIRG